MDLSTAYRYNQNMMEYYTCKLLMTWLPSIVSHRSLKSNSILWLSWKCFRNNSKLRSSRTINNCRQDISSGIKMSFSCYNFRRWQSQIKTIKNIFLAFKNHFSNEKRDKSYQTEILIALSAAMFILSHARASPRVDKKPR